MIEKAYFYILQCKDKTYYVGSTIDLDRRVGQHQEGLGAKYTKNRLPVQLVFAEEFDSIEQAFRREKQVQGWSRAKREALIKGDFDKLPQLSSST